MGRVHGRVVRLLSPFESCAIIVRNSLGCKTRRDLLCRHMGHWPLAESCFIHSRMQCCSIQISKLHQNYNLRRRAIRGNKPCGNCARTFQTLWPWSARSVMLKHLYATHIGCNHRRGICRLDMSHQSGPGRYRRHRPLEYPTSRSRRRSTF